MIDLQLMITTTRFLLLAIHPIGLIQDIIYPIYRFFIHHMRFNVHKHLPVENLRSLVEGLDLGACILGSEGKSFEEENFAFEEENHTSTWLS